MAAQPFVSIIIPCYNGESFVGEAIESALSQTYQNKEVIVIDDGSTDGSLEVIGGFGEQIHWESGPNRGGCAARNRGLALSQGAIIQFLDADDLLPPDKLEEQVPLLDGSGEEAAFVAAASTHRSQDGAEKYSPPSPGDSWAAFLGAGGRLGITSANLWRRCWLEKVGGWNTDWSSSQEAELMYRILRSGGGVVFDMESRAIVRARHGSVSRAREGKVVKHEVWRNWLRLRREAADYLRLRGEWTRERRRAYCELVVRSARLYMSQDQEEALSAIREYLDGERIPLSRENFTYSLAYNLLGFEGAEGLRMRYGKVHRLLRS